MLGVRAGVPTARRLTFCAADKYRSINVGRQLEHAGNVVEPVAHIVARQERRDVEIEIEQVAHRVAVLDAIQTMEGFRAPGIRIRGPTAIELAFEPRREAVVRRLVGTRVRRPAA
jgi:hypothetical protein